MLPARSPRICIFCGATPEKKNLEHPLPRWLLSLTGNPDRIVKHGVSWTTGKALEFSFDSLQFPSCTECNSSYSTLESAAKPIVEAISRKESASAADYVLLLDWLDKVRIGMFLGHRYLQQDPTHPTFTIDSRLGRKDRMVAIYTIGDHQVGLNAYGTETPLFQWKPSVFALRVNNTLFLNASWDWMCASRCGYPAPRSRVIDLDSGLAFVSSYRRRHRITHPIMSGIAKPCVLLFQPVLQLNGDGSFAGIAESDLDHCLANSWPGRKGLGPLFRQFADKTAVIGTRTTSVEFDTVSTSKAKPMREIVAQAYSLQNKSVRDDRYVGQGGNVASTVAATKQFVRFNLKTISALRNSSVRRGLSR